MTTTNRFYPLVLLAVALLLAPQMVQALTLKTSPADPSVAGKKITAELKVAASGVKQQASYPLAPVTGTVGETLKMGSLDSQPDKRVELRVQLPEGKYYRKVSRDELSSGTIPLTVYPKGDNSGLEISRHGILLQPFPGRLMAREYVVFKNTSQSLAGGTGNPVRFELPDEIKRIIPGPGMGDASELSSSANGYEYTNLIPPGETVVGFFYMLRPEGSSYTFERSATLPTERFAVRMPSFDKLTVSTEGLRKAEARTSGQQQSAQHKPQIYRAQGLQPGDPIQITLKGLDKISPPGGMQGQSGKAPQASSDDGVSSRPSSFSNVSWPLILGIAFSVLIFVGSYGYVQYKLAQGPIEGVGQDFLIREIANLDQEFEDGAIDEAFYKRTRRRWKQKAEEVSDGEQT